MRKGFDGNQIITVLSNLGADGSTYALQLNNTGFTARENVIEVLACQSTQVDDSGVLPVSMGGGAPKVKSTTLFDHITILD